LETFICMCETMIEKKKIKVREIPKKNTNWIKNIGELILSNYTEKVYDERRAGKIASIRETLRRRIYFLNILKMTIKKEEKKAADTITNYAKKKQIIDERKTREIMYNLEIIESGLFEAYLFFTQSFLDTLSEIIPLYYKNGQGKNYARIKSSIIKHSDSKNTKLAKVLKKNEIFDKLILHRGDIYHHPAKGVVSTFTRSFGMNLDSIKEEFVVKIPKLFTDIFDEETKIIEAIEKIEEELNNFSNLITEAILHEKTEQKVQKNTTK